MQTPEKVMVYTMGPTVLLNQLCKEIHFEETINRMVAWDQEKCRLSPGTRLKALVLNILTSHTPLYRVEDFYAEQDLALLFREPVQANDLKE